jgi:hypothetical protein
MCLKFVREQDAMLADADGLGEVGGNTRHRIQSV